MVRVTIPARSLTFCPLGGSSGSGSIASSAVNVYDGRAVSACGSYAALVAEIDNRIRFSKYFVILGDVQRLDLPQYPPGHNQATPPNYNWDSGSRFQLVNNPGLGSCVRLQLGSELVNEGNCYEGRSEEEHRRFA